MVEVGCACTRTIVLVRLDDVTHLHNIKGPGVYRMGPIGIASRDPC